MKTRLLIIALAVTLANATLAVAQQQSGLPESSDGASAPPLRKLLPKSAPMPSIISPAP